MPPRKQAAIAADPMRRDILRELRLSETEVKQLLSLDLQDALWRIGHEHTTHVAWSKRRRDFLMEEVRKASRAKPTQRVVATANLEPEFVQPRGERPAGVKL